MLPGAPSIIDTTFNGLKDLGRLLQLCAPEWWVLALSHELTVTEMFASAIDSDTSAAADSGAYIRPEVCMEQQPVKLLISALSLATQLESKAQVGASAKSLLPPNIESCSTSHTGES